MLFIFLKEQFLCLYVMIFWFKILLIVMINIKKLTNILEKIHNTMLADGMLLRWPFFFWKYACTFFTYTLPSRFMSQFTIQLIILIFISHGKHNSLSNSFAKEIRKTKSLMHESKVGKNSIPNSFCFKFKCRLENLLLLIFRVTRLKQVLYMNLYCKTSWT